MTSGDHVWRVVIDWYPHRPLDEKKWKQEWSLYLKRFGIDSRHHDPDAPWPNGIQGHWKHWRGGRRMRYLSSRSAYAHLERLRKHGVQAHVECGEVVWIRPDKILEVTESLNATLEMIENS